MVMSQKEIDIKYLREAYRFAEHSPDPSTQNGAIIVRDNSFFSMEPENLLGSGLNRFPRNVEKSTKRLERPMKYYFIEHAERNAIYSAAFFGNSTRESIMYAPWFACADCGRAIIQAGIKEVIGSTWPEKWWNERDNSVDSKRNWKESIKVALEMFDEADVKYRWVEGEIGMIKVLFDGKWKSPRLF